MGLTSGRITIYVVCFCFAVGIVSGIEPLQTRSTLLPMLDASTFISNLMGLDVIEHGSVAGDLWIMLLGIKFVGMLINLAVACVFITPTLMVLGFDMRLILIIQSLQWLVLAYDIIALWRGVEVL